jgi:hypothetical protein
VCRLVVVRGSQDLLLLIVAEEADLQHCDAPMVWLSGTGGLHGQVLGRAIESLEGITDHNGHVEWRLRIAERRSIVKGSALKLPLPVDDGT